MPMSSRVLLVLFLGLLFFLCPSVRAERLILQKGDALYAASLDGSDSRKLFPLTLSDAPVGTGAVWAASPDGRRVVWMARPAPVAQPTTGSAPVSMPVAPPSGQGTTTGNGSPTPTPAPLVASEPGYHPVSIYLSDMTGMHQKKLFSTDNLRDRRGKKIVTVGADLPGNPDDKSSARQIAQWEPLSLAWSADSRTLYVCCRLLSQSLLVKATFAVDAATGIPLIDGDGRWKSVGPVTDVDARGVILVGSGTAVSAPAASGPPALPYTPLVLSNLAEGTRTILFNPGSPESSGPLPDYAFALGPALSGNDNRYIAFTSANKGLWLLDRTSTTYRQLLDRNVSHPRWTASANALYFLESRPQADGRVLYDLNSATFAPLTGELASPQVVQQGIDWFDIIPE